MAFVSWKIVLVFLVFVFEKNPDGTWVEVVFKVAQDHFCGSVILFLDSSDISSSSRSLLPPDDDGEVRKALQILSKNFSIFYCDKNYKKPNEDAMYNLRTEKVHVVAILGITTAMNGKMLGEAIQLWRQNLVWYGQAKMLIVVKVEEDSELMVAEKIFSELWRRVKAANVVIMTSQGDFGKFLIWNPYGTSCNIDVHVAGSWQRDAVQFEDAPFPTGFITNTNNCTVFYTATALMPYVFPPGENGLYFEGVEIRIFQLLSEVVNFSYVLKPVPTGQNPWLSVSNGTPFGMIGVLYNGDADVSLSGNRLTYERFQFVSHIQSYFGDDFAWIGPIARPTPLWKSIFLVFGSKIWIIYSTAFSSAFFLVFYMHLTSNADLPLTTSASKVFFVLWAASMSGGFQPSLLGSRTVARCFVVCFLIYILIINTMYASGLYRILSQGLRERTIDSAEDAAIAGLTASIYPSNIEDLKVIVSRYYNLITTNGLVIWTMDYITCLRRAIRDGDCYTLFTALGARVETNLRFTTKSGKKLLHIMAKRYKSYDPVIYMMRDHPLLDVFRVKIQQLVECGWVLYQINDILASSMRNRTIATEVADLEGSDGYLTLSLEQLLGIFMVYIIIIVVAFLVLFCEIYCYKRQ